MANWENAPLINQPKNKWEDAPLIQSKEPSKDEGLFGALKGRVQAAEDIKRDYDSGKIGVLRAAEQAIGKVGFGTMSDVAGAAITGAAKAVTPEPAKEYLAEKAGQFAQTTIGKMGKEAIEAGGEAWDKFKADNPPEIVRDIESYANILGWLSPTKFLPKKGIKVPSATDRKAAVQEAYKPLHGKALESDVKSALSSNISKVTPKNVSKELWEEMGAAKIADQANRSVDFDDLKKVRGSLQDKINAAYKAGEKEKAADLVRLHSALTHGLEGVGGDDFIKANHAAKIDSTIQAIEGMEHKIVDFANPTSALDTRVRNYLHANEKWLSENQIKSLKEVLALTDESSMKKIASSRATSRIIGGVAGYTVGGPIGAVVGPFIGEKIGAAARKALLDEKLAALKRFKEATYALEPPLRQRSTPIGGGALNAPSPEARQGYAALESPAASASRRTVERGHKIEKLYEQQQIVGRAKQAAEVAIKPRGTIPMSGGQARLESPAASSSRRDIEQGQKILRKQKTLEQIRKEAKEGLPKPKKGKKK